MKPIFTRIILMLTLVFYFNEKVMATNYTFTATNVVNHWYNSNNWLAGNVPPAIIPFGDTAFINTKVFIGQGQDVRCNGVIIVKSSGEIQIQDSLIINPSGILINDGNIENGNAISPIAIFIQSGLFINNNSFLNKNTAKFFNSSTGITEVEGTFNNQSQMIVQTGSAVNILGVLNITNGTLTNFGTITVADFGLLQNSDSLVNKAGGGIQIFGDFKNLSSTTNEGIILQDSTGTFINKDYMLNKANSAIVIKKSFTNEGTFINAGIFQIDSFGIVNNKPNMGSSAVLYNFGANAHIYTKGEIQNDGLIENTGEIINEDYGWIYNSGIIKNFSAGIIENYDIFKNKNTFENYGLLRNKNLAKFENLSQSNFTNFTGPNSFVENDGLFDNIGNIFNQSYFANQAPGTFRNFEVFVNEAAGVFINYGVTRNDFDFSNQGFVTNVFNASIYNSAYFTNLAGTLGNYGNFYNNAGGELSNSDQLLLKTGSVLINKALLVNTVASKIEIEGNLTNDSLGSIINNGEMETLTNASFINDGTLSNNIQGLIKNNWEIINNRVITNTGTFNNMANGYFFNNDSVLGTASIINDGHILTDVAAFIKKQIAGLGFINPGNALGAGTLTIDDVAQNFNQQILHFEIDNATTCDKIITTGSSNLDGAFIQVSLNNPPQPNTSYTIISSSAFTGTNATILLPSLAPTSYTWLPPTFVNGQLVIAIGGAPLSIDDNSFTAKLQQNNSALLQWKTNAIFNHFMIERSTDGIAFEKIGMANYDNAKDEYSFIDNETLVGNNFYRIQKVTDSGDIVYSNIEKVFVSAKSNMISIYPNPTNSIIHLNGIAKNTQLIIMDMMGNVIGQHYGLTSIDVSGLASGQYQLKLVSNDVVHPQIFTKQ
jgi:Secretion system C-terminal sorting domain